MDVSVNRSKHKQTELNVSVRGAMQCNERLEQVIQNDTGLFHFNPYAADQFRLRTFPVC